MSRKRFVLVLVILSVVIGTFWLFKHVGDSSFMRKDRQSPGFNKQAHSTSEPSSVWIVVNKQRPLPSTFVPTSLRTPNVPVRGGSGNNDETLLVSETASALEQMLSAAQKDGISLQLISGYRSYNLQAIVYDSYVKTQGKAEADKTSARAGFSEHQTGLAADLANTDGKCQIETCFANTPAAQWLNSHAADYGFILRYKNGTKPIVGYDYEPWHFRYVGKDLAKEVVKSGLTLEQFFGLPPAPDYK